MRCFVTSVAVVQTEDGQEGSVPSSVLSVCFPCTLCWATGKLDKVYGAQADLDAHVRARH